MDKQEFRMIIEKRIESEKKAVEFLQDSMEKTSNPVIQLLFCQLALDSAKHEKMLELDKERYSLKETLKKLDTKFDQGIISEVDYFRTFKNLQKEIYLIEKKIQSLQNNLEEIEEIKRSSRNFDKKRYYS